MYTFIFRVLYKYLLLIFEFTIGKFRNLFFQDNHAFSKDFRIIKNISENRRIKIIPNVLQPLFVQTFFDFDTHAHSVARLARAQLWAQDLELSPTMRFSCTSYNTNSRSRHQGWQGSQKGFEIIQGHADEEPETARERDSTDVARRWQTKGRNTPATHGNRRRQKLLKNPGDDQAFWLLDVHPH